MRPNPITLNLTPQRTNHSRYPNAWLLIRIDATGHSDDDGPDDGDTDDARPDNASPSDA